MHHKHLHNAIIIIIIILQAVRYDNKEIVEQWMLYNKNQPHRNRERDNHGLAPIHYAAKFNQAKIMRILCEDGEAGNINITLSVLSILIPRESNVIFT